MSSVKSFAQRASALAFGIAALAGPALVDDSHYSGVKAMDVFLPNAVPEITIGNIAANHLLANLDLAIQETTIAVDDGGYVECLGTVSENWKEREGSRSEERRAGKECGSTCGVRWSRYH